eukprot:scaffold702_cov119-Isochrysis_galbana.AAC.8
MGGRAAGEKRRLVPACETGYSRPTGERGSIHCVQASSLRARRARRAGSVLLSDRAFLGSGGLAQVVGVGQAGAGERSRRYVCTRCVRCAVCGHDAAASTAFVLPIEWCVAHIYVIINTLSSFLLPTHE